MMRKTWTPEKLASFIERVRVNLRGEDLNGEEAMKKIYIGIDPGATGAMAVFYSGDIEGSVFDFEDPKGLEHLRWIKTFELPSLLAAIEKVHSMPKQGVASSFKFGTNFGIWQGRLQALEIPYIFVTPQKWQKVVFDSMTKGDRKAMSLDLARRLYLWADLRLKKHHGRAEALLIARYLQITEGK